MGGNKTSGDNRDDRDHDLDLHDFDDYDDDCGYSVVPSIVIFIVVLGLSSRSINYEAEIENEKLKKYSQVLLGPPSRPNPPSRVQVP